MRPSPVRFDLYSIIGSAKVSNLVATITVELTTDTLLTKSIDRLLLPIYLGKRYNYFKVFCSSLGRRKPLGHWRDLIGCKLRNMHVQPKKANIFSEFSVFDCLTE